MKLTIEIYKDKANEWRWRARAKNGNIMATGGEGYQNKADMLKAIATVQYELEYAGDPVEVEG